MNETGVAGEGEQLPSRSGVPGAAASQESSPQTLTIRAPYGTSAPATFDTSMTPPSSRAGDPSLHLPTDRRVDGAARFLLPYRVALGRPGPGVAMPMLGSQAMNAAVRSAVGLPHLDSHLDHPAG